MFYPCELMSYDRFLQNRMHLGPLKFACAWNPIKISCNDELSITLINYGSKISDSKSFVRYYLVINCVRTMQIFSDQSLTTLRLLLVYFPICRVYSNTNSSFSSLFLVVAIELLLYSVSRLPETLQKSKNTSLESLIFHKSI